MAAVLLLRLLPYLAGVTALGAALVLTLGYLNAMEKRAYNSGRNDAIAEQAAEIAALTAENNKLHQEADDRVAAVRRQNEIDRVRERTDFQRQLQQARESDATLDQCLALPSITPSGLWLDAGPGISPGAGETEGS